MKNQFSKLFLAVVLIATTVTFTNAQNQSKQDAPPPQKCNHDMKPGEGCCAKGYFGIQDLSVDQKTKIDDLKLQHMKDVTPLKDQLKEKQARINTLMDAEKTDMAAVNAAIDDLTVTTNQLIKKKAEFKLAIRNVLTDKQKIVYDAKSELFNDGCCMEGGKKDAKCGPGNGPGPGPMDHKCPDHK
jgi:Spy/CpxP family protein refolding chaperone